MNGSHAVRLLCARRASITWSAFRVQDDPEDKWLEGVTIDEALAEKTRKLAEEANAPVKARRWAYLGATFRFHMQKCDPRA